jgi:hypothetical protein
MVSGMRQSIVANWPLKGWCSMPQRKLVIIWSFVISASLAPLLSAQQTSPCRESLATFPASLAQLDSLNGSFARFELHRCAPGEIQVWGFEKGAAGPSLVFNTKDDYPSYLVHTSNILAFQSSGGSADHVYVFVFESGKPRLALQTGSKGQIQVRWVPGNRVEVSVPAISYPDITGKFPSERIRKYYFTLEE